jgi:ribonuclease VapC
MAEVVLDASAILALLRREAGHEQVGDVIADGVVSVVNEAEVISKLIWREGTSERALAVVRGLPYRLVDLDRQLARRAGVLWQTTRPQGLSFADRCCLALAERENLPVLTADARWADVLIGIDIRLITGRWQKS